MTTPNRNIIWTAGEVAAATRGVLSGDAEWRASGISIDTRTLQPGDLFVALKGDATDGHAHLAEAFARGAVAAVVHRLPENLTGMPSLISVADTFEALQDMGRASRHRCGGKIITVTGSVGKTGTKEMLSVAFGAQGQTHASKASHNNHWGVPFSLAAMHAGTDFGIFEAGMNHSGEIAPLSQMMKPHVAIITTIAAVHIGNFGSEQEIADAKSEIFEGMDHNGIAILPRDNPWFAHLRAKAETKGVRVVSFGAENTADAYIIECLQAANGSRVKARIMGQDVTFTLLIPGLHIALNALAVLLAVKALDGNMDAAIQGLAVLPPIRGRGLREYIDIGDPENPVTLIDESYNASPVAMRAAFKVLALIDPGRGGRRIAVLGDMLELGSAGPGLHRDLALPLQAADVSLVYTCGPLMKNLYDALPANQRGYHGGSSHDLAEIVPDVLTPGDVVMVKGSKSSKMGIVVEALRARKGGKRKETPHAV